MVLYHTFLALSMLSIGLTQFSYEYLRTARRWRDVFAGGIAWVFLRISPRNLAREGSCVSPNQVKMKRGVGMIYNHHLQVPPDTRFSVSLRHTDRAYNIGYAGIFIVICPTRPELAQLSVCYPAEPLQRV